MQPSVRYIILFAAAVCGVCSILVSTAAVTLQDRQHENAILDQQKKVLTVAGLIQPGESVPREDIAKRFEENLEARVVDMTNGEYVEGVDPLTYNARKAVRDESTSIAAPDNRAKVRRIANNAVVYLIRPGGGEVEGVIIPISGYGLWSTLYGYLALDRDGRTIRGITYYEHGETAGLGGEVDNPNWKALWPGRKAYDENGKPAIQVAKGHVGPPDQAPYRVDGLAGATITSNGVTNMLQLWLGENGFGPYIERFRGGAS